MDRLTLERRQVWVYLVAILCGLVSGGVWPGIASYLETLLWPVLAVLLYATFVQVPLLHIRDAFRDRRFVLAAMIG
ncbi:MAG: arsenic resistance protein, partial [Halioglobus sp.]|nr:arsenic resistance protein [Halioglobus sp.]